MRGFVPAVRQLLEDDDPVVRGTAVWAFGVLASHGHVEAERTVRLPCERDEDVRSEWMRWTMDDREASGEL